MLKHRNLHHLQASFATASDSSLISHLTLNSVLRNARSCTPSPSSPIQSLPTSPCSCTTSLTTRNINQFCLLAAQFFSELHSDLFIANFSQVHPRLSGSFPTFQSFSFHRITRALDSLRRIRPCSIQIGPQPGTNPTTVPKNLPPPLWLLATHPPEPATTCTSTLVGTLSWVSLQHHFH